MIEDKIRIYPNLRMKTDRNKQSCGFCRSSEDSFAGILLRDQACWAYQKKKYPNPV